MSQDLKAIQIFSRSFLSTCPLSLFQFARLFTTNKHEQHEYYEANERLRILRAQRRGRKANLIEKLRAYTGEKRTKALPVKPPQRLYNRGIVGAQEGLHRAAGPARLVKPIIIIYNKDVKEERLTVLPVVGMVIFNLQVLHFLVMMGD